MRWTTETIRSEVRFIGHLWQGNMAAGCVEFPPEMQAHWNREAVLEWLRHGKKINSELTPSGDFQDIVDFACDFSEGEEDEAADWKSPWEKDESAQIWDDCMFPNL